MNLFEELFSPICIGNLRINNRIVFPPIATNLGDDDGNVTEQLIEYYVTRAKGGAGLIIVESCAVAPEGKATIRQLSIFSDQSIDGYRQLNYRVHQYGTKIFLQLQHAGRSSVSEYPVAPSPIPCPLVGKIPRELTIADIQDLIEKYGEATRRAKEAGFDGVEVHLAHGYLLNEFLSPLSNQRTDDYGGSFENRLRFPLQVVQRVREIAGDKLTVICRISASEFMVGGLTLDDMKIIAEELVNAGVEAIHVSGGTYGSVEWIIQPYLIEPGCFIPLAEQIKKKVSVPVIVAGRISPEVALEAIRNKKVDLVAIGRGMLADPNLPNKLKEGKREDIIPCISCNQGCIGQVLSGNSITCLLNPLTGREKEVAVLPATKKKEIVVIGGGPAGLKAAAIAAQRGHQVTLYEKNDDLGGQFRLATYPPHKNIFKEGLNYLIREVERAGVKVVKPYRVDGKNISALKGDIAIIAVGSEPIIPDIDGITDKKVVTAADVLTEKIIPGFKTAIIGGGLVGCEVASFIVEKYQNEVTIFEMLSDIAQDMVVINKIALAKYFLQKENLSIITLAKVLSVKGGEVIYRKNDHEISGGNFNTVVIAVGSKSRDEIKNVCKNYFKNTKLVGDCKSPRKALEAIAEGFFAGLEV